MTKTPRDPASAYRRTADGVMWAALLACAAFTTVAGTGALYGPDRASILFLQTFANGLFDAVGDALSFAGDAGVITAAFGLLCVYLFFYEDRSLAVRLVIAYAAMGLVELAMKLAVPVPPIPPGLGRSPDYNPALEVPYSYPYPSGHMLRMVFALGAVYLLWPAGTSRRLVRVTVILVLALVALTRVYLGVHWPSDVIGGALIGVLGLAWAFRNYSPKKPRA